MRCLCAVLACAVLLAAPAWGQHGRAKSPRKKRPAKSLAASTAAAAVDDTANLGDAEKELAQLARALHDGTSPKAYDRLADFAKGHASSELGAHAALALGYYDYTKGHHSQAAKWLDKAQPNETVLREYVLYWRTQVNRVQGHNAQALDQLESFRRDFPDSVLTETVVQALGETALLIGKFDHAVVALEAYEKTDAKPYLLLLRGEARDKTELRPGAARDFQDVYYRFPLADEAKLAEKHVSSLEHKLGPEFPAASLDAKIGRAAAFYDAKRWKDARAEYEKLLPELARAGSSVDLQRAQVHIAECHAQLHGPVSALASLQLTEPDVDAERLYVLSQEQRSRKNESEMLAAIEQLASRYPQSHWNEEGLFAAGNYCWVILDRPRAASYYHRVLEQFPSGKYAQTAQWRSAWVAYLERRTEAASLLEEHVRRYPMSPHMANALYWLGRAAERGDNVPHARSFYLKDKERFPETYFGRLASARLDVIGTDPVNSADFLSVIPPAGPLPSLQDPIPPAAQSHWERAQALRTIAFDSSAELEFRAGYALSSAPRLLWEAAASALDAGHYSVGIATVRQVYPQLEARRIDEVPSPVWHVLFPLPYEDILRRAAARNRVDPMVVAGIIRQESVFQPDAVSHADAVGLMQVLPRTGKTLVRRLKLRFSRAKLFDPEYNLLLGSLYVYDLLGRQGSPEAALAAFNAGEDRVASWKAERNYEEPPEFVESIPFTETREYVQIVLRNTELYRLLYSKPQ